MQITSIILLHWLMRNLVNVSAILLIIWHKQMQNIINCSVKIFFSTGYYEGTDGHRREYMTCKGNVTEYKYILNLTTKEYIEIPEDNPDEWQEHPLPILLADGNGRGGGDYEGSNMQMVGKWKFNRIGATNNVPKGFKKLEVTFKER